MDHCLTIYIQFGPLTLKVSINPLSYIFCFKMIPYFVKVYQFGPFLTQCKQKGPY